MYNHITPNDIYNNEEIKTYITSCNEFLNKIGYTEHGLAHAKRCSTYAYNILKELSYDERMCELAAISGYMHDIGNIVNRADHAHSGALMAFTILNKLNMPPREIALICSAIGNHDEHTAYPVNPVAAALILSDKSDVRRSRVQQFDLAGDIHDRVCYAVIEDNLTISATDKTCILSFTIDTEICPVMEYFEIFLERMILCRKSADTLGLTFELIINKTRLL